MRAAWCEKQGAARDVLTVGEMDDPRPRAGEVRIRIAASGINPGDVKKRQNAFGYGMPFPRIIPHSDGAGMIDGEFSRYTGNGHNTEVFLPCAPRLVAASGIAVPDSHEKRDLRRNRRNGRTHHRSQYPR